MDGLIGQLASLASPDALVLLVSPGWRGRPGVLLGGGPDIVAGAFQGGDLLDIAPTVLARFGLAASDLPGRTFPGVASTRPLRATIPPPRPPRVEAQAELLQAAAAAGYTPPPRPSPEWQAQGLAELACILAPRSFERSRELAEAALERHPDNLLALSVAAIAHANLADPARLPDFADRLERLAPTRGWAALARGAYHVLRNDIADAVPWLIQAEADPDSDIRLQVATLWLAAHRPLKAETVFKTILASDPANASAEIGLAMTLAARRAFLEAEQALLRALKTEPGRVAAYLQLAQIYAITARPIQAERAAAQAVRLGGAPEQADLARRGRLGI